MAKLPKVGKSAKAPRLPKLPPQTDDHAVPSSPHAPLPAELPDVNKDAEDAEDAKDAKGVGEFKGGDHDTFSKMNKRGRISRAEDRQIYLMIQDNAPMFEIARTLGRRLCNVEAHVKKYYGVGDNLPVQAVESAEFLRKLRASDHWKFLKEHYSSEELDYYEGLFARVMAQFKEDILPTEELQVLQALDAVIMVNRHKKARKSVEDKIVELDRLIDINKIDAENDDEAAAKILAWESQKQLLFSQANARTKDFTELTKKFDETIGKLKGTREQRIKNIESSKQSWTALIKTMQDRKTREKEGRHMELFRLATNKAENELRQPYKYINGRIDQPFLSSDHILIDVNSEDDASDVNDGSDVPLQQTEEVLNVVTKKVSL